MEVKDLELSMLFGIAVKAEIESKKVYEKLEKRIKNILAKERFRFLVGEEEKHEALLRYFFKKTFADKEIIIPEKTPVPLPTVEYDESKKISEIIEQAMEAETAARDFYKVMAEKAKSEGKDVELVKMLNYLAQMEQNHYNLLETELEAARQFEAYDSYWEMMHVGP